MGLTMRKAVSFHGYGPLPGAAYKAARGMVVIALPRSAYALWLEEF